MTIGTQPSRPAGANGDKHDQPKVEVEQPRIERRIDHRLHAGVRLTIRGRTIHLRGIPAPRTGLLGFMSTLGPGLIAATAGDDAGGIATYTQVGAKYGYDLLWVLVLITVTLAVVQEMCARLGAATGRGLIELVRERFGIGWAIFAVAIVLIANGGVIVTEFLGIAAAAELFGITRYFAVPLAAVLVWYFDVQGSYSSVEKLFLAMALVFFAYPIAVIMANPDLGGVARGIFIPTVRADPDYLPMLVALIGTTVTPYMQLFQQSAVVEKGVARQHYGPERADAYFGALFSNIMVAMIVMPRRRRCMLRAPPIFRRLTTLRARSSQSPARRRRGCSRSVC